ncbi:MAG: hypothetical protein HN769_14440 [Anaerolineae bacterium]|nr:hypothetical protein [Anaerolineae bacterium]
MEKVKARIPPNYVNGRSDVLYGEGANGLIVSYFRIVGLAWQDSEHRHLPEMTGDELCQLLRCKRSTLLGHLKELSSLGLLEWKSEGGRFRIQITPRIQNSGFSLNDDDEIDTIHKSRKTSSRTDKIQKTGFTPQEEKDHEILGEVGVEIKPEETIQSQIQKTPAIPSQENRGGSRKKKTKIKSPTIKQAELPSAPIPKLPDAILSDLSAIGWTDTGDEVLLAYIKDPERVAAWLHHVQHIPEKEIRKSRAGFFRHGLRSDVHPPKLSAKTEYRDFAEDEDDFELENSEKSTTEKPLINIEPKLQKAWDVVLSQLRLNMAPHTFNTWVENTYPLSLKENILHIQAHSKDAQEWLEGRIKSTAENLLVGVLNTRVVVEFVAEQK